MTVGWGHYFHRTTDAYWEISQFTTGQSTTVHTLNKEEPVTKLLLHAGNVMCCYRTVNGQS